MSLRPDFQPRPAEIGHAAVFTAGNGQRYGLVSLADSDQVVVFKWHAEQWVGTCQFGPNDSQGIWPGVATPEVVEALNA